MVAEKLILCEDFDLSIYVAIYLDIKTETIIAFQTCNAVSSRT